MIITMSCVSLLSPALLNNGRAVVAVIALVTFSGYVAKSFSLQMGHLSGYTCVVRVSAGHLYCTVIAVGVCVKVVFAYVVFVNSSLSVRDCYCYRLGVWCFADSGRAFDKHCRSFCPVFIVVLVVAVLEACVDCCRFVSLRRELCRRQSLAPVVDAVVVGVM